MEFKQVKKELGLNNKMIADMFGYASEAAYRNTTSKGRIECAIVQLYERFKSV